MATRLYLGQRALIHGNVAFDAGWEKTTGAIRKLLSQDKFGDAMVTTSIAANGTSGDDTLLGQWVSEPLDSNQIITGTFKGQMRMAESAAGLDARVQLIAYVIQSDLSTVRGVLIAMSTAALSHEFNTALRNITMPLGGSASVSSVSAQTGDRIVVEVGARQHATASGNVQCSSGDSSGTDLAEDETTTTANNPWVEFSQTITFALPELVVAQAPVEVLYTPSSPEVRFAQVALEVAYKMTTTVQEFQVVFIDTGHEGAG